MHATIALIVVLLLSLPVFSEDLEGTWKVTTPEGEPVSLFISITLRADSTVTLVSELPDEETGDTFTYLISGFWRVEGDMIYLNLIEAEGHVQGMTVKDEAFEGIQYSGSIEYPAPDRLVLHLTDENGTGFSMHFSRAATSVPPIEWGKLKARFQS